MATLTETMMNTIAMEVCGKQVDSESFRALSEEELKKLFTLSKRHDVAHIVGNALIKCGALPDGEIKKAFEKEVFTAIYRYEKLNYEMGEIRRALTEAGIMFLPLKGTVIRKFYPAPWQRTSCDIDVLVREEDLKRAIFVLESSAEYVRESKNIGGHDAQLLSKSGMRLELHYNLLGDEVVGSSAAFFKDIWNYAEAADGTSELSLTDGAYYCYHIAHMAKHFVYGGCGVRTVLDVWILNHKLVFDENERRKLLDKCGLGTFASYVEQLAEIWFGDRPHNDTTEGLEYFVLKGGVYGTVENRVYVQRNKEGGKFRFFLSRIWLPYDVLKFQYPVLKKHKGLLPIYEIRRWFRLLSKGRAKSCLGELKISSKSGDENVMKMQKLLEDLKL